MVLGVLSSLSKILLRMGALLLYFNCVRAVCILCLYLMVPLVGLQSVIVAFVVQRTILWYVTQRLVCIIHTWVSDLRSTIFKC